MKKLDRYILRSFIGPFVAILLVVVFILMMQFLWLYIDELVGKGLSFSVILEFLWWGVCISLPLALPLAVLLSSIMIIGSMSENNELMAIKATGISLWRIMFPLIGAAFVISVGAFFCGNVLVPEAYNQIYTLREDIDKTKGKIKIPSGTFYEGIEGYVLRTEGQNKESGMMYGVMVYDHSNHKGNAGIILADSALLKMSKAKDYLTFTLYDGSSYQEDNQRSWKDTTMSLQRMEFSRQELLIRLNNYTFEKSDSSRYGDQVKSMRLSQLLENKDSLDRKTADAHTDHYRQFRLGNCFLEKSQLDTARRNPDLSMFENEHYMKWDNEDEIVEAYGTAIQAAERLASDAMSYNQDVYAHNFYQRRTDVEMWKKFAQALACFILFFIGAPLGALIKKGGLGVSFIISALFFVLYWVVDISGTKLANDGSVSPFNGVFISAYVLIPIGAFFTWKAVHDSDLFNMDTYKSAFRRIWSHISRFFRKTRIVYMGTPEFAVAPLDKLIKSGYDVVGVVTVADKPSGRGLKVNESAVKKYAVEHGIPVLQPVKLRDPEFLDALRAWKADLFVVVAFRMLPEEVWKMPRLGTFNLHAALLPQYRGAAPINWAVINGEKMTGVTTFMIDKNIDTGGIILRQECRIEPEDTAGDVHDKLMAIGADLVVETVEGIIQKNIELRVQRSFVQGSEVLKPAPKLSKELCHIDWNKTSDIVNNLIRGLSPYPTAYTELVDAEGKVNSLKIFKAEIVDMHADKPGTVLTDGKTYLAITTANGALSLKDIQLGGKKRMDVKSFLLGFRDADKYSAC